MRIIRVFPRKTNATPTDELAVVNRAPYLFEQADEIHISVTWTWDMNRAEWLEKQWRHVAPVKIGGPATAQRRGDFSPGMYLRPGYVITSRGCPNRCWFCDVWKRWERLEELPIMDGWNVLDDNLLACSEGHIRAVFAMLAQQKGQRIEFTGGLEAARMKPWISEELRRLKPKQLFFAYDTPGDLEPLREAARMLLEAGFTTASHTLRCYVLCGWGKDGPRKEDTFAKAEKRMRQTIDAGFVPMAMLYRDKTGKRDIEWMRFQKRWARPALICR